MWKKFLLISCFSLIITACFSNNILRSENESFMPALSPTAVYQVQVKPTTLLPPYGLQVRADVAAVHLRLNTTKDSATDKLADIQSAVQAINTLTDQYNQITLASINTLHIEGSDRTSSIDSGYWTMLDTSNVTLKLTTPITESTMSLGDSLTMFNTFLSTLTLAETITLEVSSIEAEISNSEQYRQQLINQVYQELQMVQNNYGEAVTYEINGLHTTIQTISLSDVEYYLYLEPVIVVKEF